jgi:AcrR family transcriptional regulator
MPRALTEKEKCAQCERLLEKGKAIVFLHGIRKVSVDDIAKAAGMAKGTFYQHFDTKERYLLTLLKRLHSDIFQNAKAFIFNEAATEEGLRENVRVFMQQLLYIPEMVFFIQNERDIDLLIESFPDEEMRSFKEMEEGLFEGIMRMGGIDTDEVKPGVVHNFVHTLFLISASELMAKEDLQETLRLITESMIAYIFDSSGGSK